MSETFTAETRAKAAQTRTDQKAFVNANFKLDWADEPLWLELAKTHNVRLPGWYARTTAGRVSRWSKTLQHDDFRAIYGCTAKRLLELNPRQPLRAFVGQMLETLPQP